MNKKRKFNNFSNKSLNKQIIIPNYKNNEIKQQIDNKTKRINKEIDNQLNNQSNDLNQQILLVNTYKSNQLIDFIESIPSNNKCYEDLYYYINHNNIIIHRRNIFYNNINNNITTCLNDKLDSVIDLSNHFIDSKTASCLLDIKADSKLDDRRADNKIDRKVDINIDTILNGGISNEAGHESNVQIVNDINIKLDNPANSSIFTTIDSKVDSKVYSKLVNAVDSSLDVQTVNSITRMVGNEMLSVSNQLIDLTDSYESQNVNITTDNTIIPAYSGVVRVVREDGCTIRDQVDIDNSNVIHKCSFNEVLFFDSLVVYPGVNDEDTIDVNRLHVYVTLTNGLVIDGWASMTGRLLDDSLPILQIVKPFNSSLLIN